MDEITKLKQERDSARAIARVLAHAYSTDNRPPPRMVAEARAFPVYAESAIDIRCERPRHLGTIIGDRTAGYGSDSVRFRVGSVDRYIPFYDTQFQDGEQVFITFTDENRDRIVEVTPANPGVERHG